MFRKQLADPELVWHGIAPILGRYYFTHCIKSEDGGWVSREMRYPLSTHFSDLPAQDLSKEFHQDLAPREGVSPQRKGRIHQLSFGGFTFGGFGYVWLPHDVCFPLRMAIKNASS
jgi:hypothetical protein